MPAQDRPETLLAIFRRRVATDGPKPAVYVKHEGRFTERTWNDLAIDVRRTAAALERLGVCAGDRVAQFAENRYEWIVTDLAIQTAAAVHVPLHAPLTGSQAAFQINDSDARVVLISGAEQAEKLAGQADRLDARLHVIAFDPCDVRIGGRPVQSLTEITADVDEQAAAKLEERALSALTPDSLATILYTSGTTGESKGVMLSQRNLVSNTWATYDTLPTRPDDLRLSFLPLSHVFARTCDLYTWIAAGAKLALTESRETVLADCATLGPTLLSGVPYFFDKVYRDLVEQGLAEQPGSLAKLLGGNMRLCCCGGAALADHVFEFFQRQKVPLLQGYGLTETSPVITISTESVAKAGAVGQPIPDVEVKIAADGEILTRGPHVMPGYWKNQAATDEIIKDGWLHTGDIGRLDEQGCLRITGRKKELIVTAGGKNVAPVLLEALLTEDPLVLQALVIGDDRNYLTALVVPDPDALRAEIEAHNIPVAEAREALVHLDVLALYRERIDRRLASLSGFEQIGKFTLLDRGFTIQSGEMTLKLSLRRSVIEANFAEQIEAMYHKG